MLIFLEMLVITKQCFQNIRRTFHEFLFKKYSKDIPGILECYENVFMKSKSFVGYPVKFLILTIYICSVVSKSAPRKEEVASGDFQKKSNSIQSF